MRQLFQNLTSNGLKYHKPGSHPVLSIKNVSSENGFHTISFEDNGIGLEERHRERIFKPFSRLHSGKEYNGSGLGLFICKKIVTGHNGTIIVQSKIGEGSTFIITLPEKQTVEKKVKIP